jgi:hypothetical protein
MTISEIAERENVSTRQVQRYCRAPGFSGHVLKAVLVGKAYHVTDSDYRQWRIDCGFEKPMVPRSARTGSSEDPPSSPGDARPLQAEAAVVLRPPKSKPYPPYPMPADPHGVITNCPHPRSSNWPHPDAVAEHQREEVRKQLAKYRHEGKSECDYDE